MGRRTGTDDLENRVRALREAAGLSQGELANRAGITRQAVSAIESGGYVPNTAVALRLSRALGCTVEDLFRISDISLKLRVRPGSAIGEWSEGEQRVQLARVGEDVVVGRLAGHAHHFLEVGRQRRRHSALGVLPHEPDELLIAPGFEYGFPRVRRPDRSHGLA
jgi:DNA-binding XRE family transcriptional regulator